MNSTHINTLLKVFLVLAVVFQIIAITQGFYFLGDTNNYIEHALQGSPLTTFLWHHPIWPPLTAIVFNILFNVFGVLTGIKVYLVALSAIAIFACYQISKSVKLQKPSSILLPILLLFSGQQYLLWQTALSEPLFLTLWLVATYLSFAYIEAEKIKYLVLLTIVTALLPLTRYLGGIVSLSFWFFFVLYIVKTKKTANLLLIIQSAILSFVPMCFYLLRNKIQTGSFMPLRDTSNVLATVIPQSLELLITSTTQIGIWLLIAFVMGLTVSWRKRYFPFLALLIITSVSYIIALLVSTSKYPVYEYIPGRYISSSYPFLILSSFFVGSLLTHTKKLQFFEKTKKVVITATLLLLLISFVTKLQKFYLSNTSFGSPFKEVAYTSSLRRHCPNYVVIHPHSRNWVGQSLGWLCQTTMVRESQLLTLAPAQTVLSPYILSIVGEAKEMNYAGKTLFLYSAANSQTIELQPVFDTRKPLD